MWLKRLYIKCCRYLLGRRFLPVMSGVLKGYAFTTERSYEYLLGNYESPEVLTVFQSWCGEGTVFYDLGAAVGYHTLLADRFITGGTILAFEPFPANASLFREHLQRNEKRLGNNKIELLTSAVAEEDGELLFSANPVQTDGNSYISTSPVFSNSGETITVQAYSIDSLLQQGYPVPWIIKIDVEGAEYDVLKGARQTLDTHHPNLLLATHDFHLPGVKENCIAFLKSLGYTLQHTGHYNQQVKGLDDYICIHQSRLS